MHYKNWREAKAGDRAVNLNGGQSGILYGLSAASTTCNARLTNPNSTDPYVTISECLHIDDVAAASVPDSTKT